jgi:hypothetical protein
MINVYSVPILYEAKLSFFPFLLGYLHCAGGFTVTIPNSLTYIVHWIDGPHPKLSKRHYFI